MKNENLENIFTFCQSKEENCEESVKCIPHT
jgi:hypothetical protein